MTLRVLPCNTPVDVQRTAIFLDSLMEWIERAGRMAARVLFWIAGAAIVFMMLLTCADVILRYFRMPIPGTYELVCYLGALGVGFAMAHTSVEKGHVAVSVLVRLLPRRAQGFIGSVTVFFSLVFFMLISWQSWSYADQLRRSGEVSLTLQLPFHPFVYGIAVAAGAVFFVLLGDLARQIKKVFAA